MSNLKLILMPFAWLYDFITATRNFLYDRDIRKSVQFDTNVVVVGNLSVGGTGKTPMIEYLIRNYSGEFNIAILSRGYKRNTKGFRIVNDTETPRTVGDEPFQIFNKFKNIVTVAVGEERETAIPFILAEHPEKDLILLDDGFQHRVVRPTLSLILSHYSKPFFDDFTMPYGSLRENRNQAARADIIVITNCPELDFNEQQSILRRIRKYAEASVFFGGIKYGNPSPLNTKNSNKISKRVLLVSGIANPVSFVNFCSAEYEVVGHLEYPDHKTYNKYTVQEILEKYIDVGENVSILTTEKDIVKLMQKDLRESFDTVPIFYLPIEFYFLEDEKKFNQLFCSIIKCK